MFVVNSKSYKTKKSLEEGAKQILYSGSVNEALTGNDFDFMLDYFRVLHVEFDQKQGCGIAQIVKIIEPMYGKYRGFKIVRIDGSETDISYRISNIFKKNHFRDFKEALRDVVEPQVHAFKISALVGSIDAYCPFTGERLSYGYCHVDHYGKTFHELVEEFCEAHGITEADIPSIISKPEDNQLLTQITDEYIKNGFYIFHKNNANLRLLSPIGNLSWAKRNERSGN